MRSAQCKSLRKRPVSCRIHRHLAANIVMSLIRVPAQRKFVMHIDKRHNGAALSLWLCPLTLLIRKFISTSNFLCTPTSTRPPQCELKMRSMNAANGLHFLCRVYLLPCQPSCLPWQAWALELGAVTSDVKQCRGTLKPQRRASIDEPRVAICCGPAVSPTDAVVGRCRIGFVESPHERTLVACHGHVSGASVCLPRLVQHSTRTRYFERPGQHRNQFLSILQANAHVISLSCSSVAVPRAVRASSSRQNEAVVVPPHAHTRCQLLALTRTSNSLSDLTDGACKSPRCQRSDAAPRWSEAVD